MKLTTSVYKYKPYAPFFILLAPIVFFSISLLPTVISIIAVVLFVLVAIYAALRPKSIFSPRSVDDRKLILTQEELIWGDLHMPVHDVKKLEVYIHAFDTFRYYTYTASGKRRNVTAYGDRNKISFSYKGVAYDLTFFLGVFADYDILVRIIQTWRNQGVDVSARSAFSDSYIRHQVHHAE